MMTNDIRIKQRTLSGRIARVITEVFAPAVLATAMPLVIAVHAAPTLWRGLGWGVFTVVFTAVIPYGVVWLGVRRGQLTDHHIGVRHQRRRPLLFGLSSVLVGLVALLLFGAPRPLVAMVVVMFAVLLGIAAINQVWKLSAHAAVAAGSSTMLTIVFGPILLFSAVAVVLIGWSRIRLRDHTAGQVIAGAVVGALIAGPAFALLQ